MNRLFDPYSVLTISSVESYAGKQRFSPWHRPVRSACCAFLMLLWTSHAVASGYSVWRTELPSLVLNDVDIDAENEERLWQLLSYRYLIRPVRVDWLAQPLSEEPFTFRAAQCTIGGLLDAVAERYGRSWSLDEESGVLWVCPKGFDLTQLDLAPATFEKPLLGVPMRSGMFDGYIEGLKQDRLSIEMGPFGIIRGYYPYYRFAEYAVDIPRGEHTLRDLINLSCEASPSQSFIVRYYRGMPTQDKSTYIEIDIATDSITLAVPVSPALHAYASRYLGVEADVEINTATLAKRLSHSDPKLRLFAQHYVEMTETIYSQNYAPDGRLSQVENLWYALAYDRYDKMSNEGFPRVSDFIGNTVTEDFLLTHPDNHLVLLLALERARIEQNYAWLRILEERKFQPDQLHGLEREVSYIARRCEMVWNALRDPNNEIFIDTEGWAPAFLDTLYPKPFEGFMKLPHPKESK